MKYINEFKNKHLNEDIWVICAGSSMNYVDPSFFENKTTIGLNHVGVKYKTNYTVIKDLVVNGFNELANCENPPFNSDYVIASEWDKGYGYTLNTDITLNKTYEKYQDKFYFFKHIKNGHGNTTAIKKDSDMLFISTSTITTAVHFAGYMGAKNIMICGHDLLAIDNKLYFDEYTKKSNQGTQKYWNNRDFKNDTMKLRDIMKQEYDTNIYTLNPFIGFGLEGHTYDSYE